MKKTAIIGICLAGLLCASCTDDLLPSASGEIEDAGGIAFGVSVVEQADMIYDYGRTRAAAGEPALDSATIVANTFGAHVMEGDNPWGMNIHRMPLPFVGIHPGSASTDEEQLATRAPLTEIAGNDLLFHDSLTIWGYTDKGRELFSNILLKKIRGWRSSVHWPYDKEVTKVVTSGQLNPEYMLFYAFSPALEELDITLKNSPGYGTAPIISFVVPEEPAEQRDLLYGCSAAVDVQAGPTPGYGGSGTGYYEGQASTQKEQHLGQDDKTVALTFKHILTAVRFAQGKMPVDITIKRITLAHIKSQGVYDPAQGKWGNMTGDPLTWSDDLPDKYSTYTIYPNKSITNYSYEENVYIDGDSVLFLMPQTLVEGAELQIVLTEDSAPTVERTLKCSLKDDVWNPGYTVTYKVTIGELKGEYYLVLDTGTDDVTIPKHGDTGTETKYSNGAATHETSTSTTSGSFIIHSFRNAKDYSTSSSGTNKHQKADWQMTGFSWNGTDGTYSANNRPAWLQSITGWTNVSNEVGQSAGNQTPSDAQGQQTIDYVLEAQSYTHKTTHSTVLASNVEVSNFDLSQKQPDGTRDGTPKTRESANCYIVNATGTYKFPAVYGNGITGGSVADLTANTLFLDHRGNAIKYANIYKQLYETEAADIETDITDERTASEIGAGATTKKKFTHQGYRYVVSDLGTTPGLSVELIWQDASGVFTVASTGITQPTPDDSGFSDISFTVNTAKPANCVIALKGRLCDIVTTKAYDSGGYEITSLTKTTVTTASPAQEDVLWTWHIWMTDEVYPNQTATKVGLADGAVTNDATQRSDLSKTMDELYPSYYNGSKIVQLLNADGTSTGCRQMLPVNLGWVPDDDAFGLYQQRDTWVEIQLKDAPDQKVHFHIHQDAKPDLITGTSTMYQWGRPTALPMVNKISGTERTIYGATGSTSITNHFGEEQVGPASIMAAVIGHPKKLIRNNADGNFWWPDALAHAYWGETKTLYDPCPPGFQMPPSSVFGWMTKDDMENNIGTAFLNTNVSKTLNMWDGELGGNMGGYFYAKKHETLPVPPSDRYLQKFYFPATSYYATFKSGSGTQLKNWFVTEDRQAGVCWTYQLDTRLREGETTEVLQGRVVDFLTDHSGIKLDDDLIVNLHAIRPFSQ